MKYKYLLTLVIFLIGWFSYSHFTSNSFEIPFSLNSTELASPNNHIKEDQIRIYKDRIVIEIDKPYWSKFANTNSMDPLIDENSNGIEIKPISEDQIIAGDIISYKYNNSLIIHRVMEVGQDTKGWYAITKGDNNTFTDQEKVRFNQVEGILIGILY